MPRLTEHQFLAKGLRGLAAYHEPRGTLPIVDAKFLRAIRDLGVLLDPPATRTLGELTVSQCTRYADQLDTLDRAQGAA